MSNLLKAQDYAAQAKVAPLPADTAKRGFVQAMEDGTAFAEQVETESAPANPPAMASEESHQREPSKQRDDRQVEFEAAIAGMQEDLRQASEDADAREEDAYDRGLRDGRASAASDEEARTQLIAATLEKMLQTQAARVAECELLALQIARAALAKIFCEDNSLRAPIEATIERNMAHVARELVLRLRISTEDFPSEGDCAGIVGRFPGLAITTDPALPAGSCIADLKLGTLDLGLPGQWQSLSALFDRLEQGIVAE